MIPLAAWTRPMPNSRPAYWSSAWVSLAATPRSIARPITNGITAWLLIQTMPKNIPREQGAPLTLGHPPQEAHRGPVVRGAGMVERELPHPATLRRRRV